jgi:hypothetical protein
VFYNHITNKIIYRQGDFYLDSQLNDNKITTIEDINRKLYEDTKDYNIVLHKNLHTKIKEHFQKVNNMDISDEIKESLINFRGTMTKITDNNKTSSRSHLIHYLLLYTPSSDSVSYTNSDDEYIELNINKYINNNNMFKNDFTFYIIIDTMGFENIMNGLGNENEKDLFHYMHNPNLIDDLSFYQNKVKISNTFVTKEYLVELGKEAAILLQMLSVFINTPLNKLDALKRYEKDNILNKLIRDKIKYIEDNDKDSIEDYVCFLPLIFFRQDINISKLIYNFYKKLTSLVDEEQFMETIYSHVNKYDNGSLIEHHESLLKELNNK